MNNETHNIPHSPKRSPQRKEAGDVTKIAITIMAISTCIGAIVVLAKNHTKERAEKAEKAAEAATQQLSRCETNCSLTETNASLLNTAIDTALDGCQSDDCCLEAEADQSAMHHSLGITDTVCNDPKIATPCKEKIHDIVGEAQERFRNFCLRGEGFSPREIRNEEANSGK